jgi:hypothetical protein
MSDITLVGNISPTVTVLTVNQDVQPAPGDKFLIDDEIIEFGVHPRVPAPWGSTLGTVIAVERGVAGTVAASHTSGAVLTPVLPAYSSAVPPIGGGGTVSLPWFNVTDYGAVGDGVTDDGPAISAAILAASLTETVYTYTPVTVLIPPGDYRVATTIVVKDKVRIVGYGANLIGPITSYPYIDTATTAAGGTDVAAQTAGACFSDTTTSTATLNGLAFDGLHLVGFRYGFVTLCLSWSYAHWRDVFFENCNVGILCYQGAIGHRIEGTLSGGAAAGTTYIAAATCFPAGHAYGGRDNFFCDGFIYDNTGWGRDGSVANADFDTWFAASILRASTGSVVISGTITYGFTGDLLKPTGRCIYIPSRNKRNIYQPEIRKAVSENCARGIAAIANPVDGSFENMNGESMFAAGADAIVNVLLTNTDCTGLFENIDGTNTTNPGYAITVTPEPGGSSGPGTFYDNGNILGTINGLVTHFVSTGTSRRDIWIGPFNPAEFTQTGAMTAANYAFTSPFNVGMPRTVVGARTYIAVQSGNICVGVYASTGGRLATTGSIACPAAGERAITFTAPVTLYPGRTYYLAFAADNTSVATAVRTGIIATGGYEGLGSEVLPATLTLPGNAALENFMWVLTE